MARILIPGQNDGDESYFDNELTPVEKLPPLAEKSTDIKRGKQVDLYGSDMLSELLNLVEEVKYLRDHTHKVLRRVATSYLAMKEQATPAVQQYLDGVEGELPYKVETLAS